jgi:peptidoglycan/LPS O-acetylase OafA/YrhL
VIGVSPIPAGPALFAAVAAGTVVVALASWRFFERPINDLKRLIPYTDRRVTAAAETDSLVIANRDALPRIK